MSVDYTLVLLSVASATLLMITVVVYDRMVRSLRNELEEARADAALVDLLLDTAINRHPAKGDQ